MTAEACSLKLLQSVLSSEHNEDSWILEVLIISLQVTALVRGFTELNKGFINVSSFLKL